MNKCTVFSMSSMLTTYFAHIQNNCLFTYPSKMGVTVSEAHRLEIIDFIQEHYRHLYENLPPLEAHKSKAAWSNLVQLFHELGYVR